MNKIIALWVGVLLACVSLGVRADTPEPEALIRNTVDEVLTIVKRDKDIQTGNTKKVLELVDAKVLPHFNFTRMTRLAVGKNWGSATSEQKKTLEIEFRNLLVRTYTTAFTTYQNQEVEVKPLKMANDANEVTVKTSIINKGKPPVSVNYDMEKTAHGWKAYDLTIEGVSLVTNYRGTFNDKIQKSGIDGLIKMLVEKNQAQTGTMSPKATPK
ncbi:Phospholipid transport system substrate-binding protein [Candidatus Nitrotoga sp. HW29]|uniref:MlaC/ttg2D family ABC transporter substrate-binding protein n=1 Tax=Candidatus Nitrotoga sp. HW29 TaxID=2886963 RepID=UPI001EF1EFC2|nr:ABC transporter substrate-binding protein [Candidatus Nitrotoga sp. HW29]CAH1904329.1 Phospholipid transport system substrate-binding protein [Candidatus Nitrotoga sp. HW29]